METIFDHNPTADELTILTGSIVTGPEYTAVPRDAQTELGRIYGLYTLRGDAVRAGEYLARIADPLYRHDLSTSDLHP